MKYYIAIDAGGTKTDSVLFDQEGHVLARDLRRGANAFDLGPMEAAARISGAVEMLQERLEKANMQLYFGDPSLSTDNAVGVALLTRDRRLQEANGWDRS